MANFKRNTRYTNGLSSKNREGVDFLLLRKSLKLVPDSGDTFVSIKQEDILRPDLISQKAYGQPDLWWVIFEYNNIQDPLFELKESQILKIPGINRVLAAIKNLGKI